jgi:hypothetical protein
MKYLFVVLALVIFSCQNDQNRYRLDQEKMAEILVDIHLDEVKISRMEIISPDTNLLLYHQMEKATLKKHAIDSASFVKSFDSYVREPKDFIKLYERVNEIMKDRKKLNESSRR